MRNSNKNNDMKELPDIYASTDRLNISKKVDFDNTTPIVKKTSFVRSDFIFALFS